MTVHEQLALDGEIWLPHNDITASRIGTLNTYRLLHSIYNCELKMEVLSTQALVQATSRVVAEQMDQGAKDRHTKAPRSRVIVPLHQKAAGSDASTTHGQEGKYREQEEEEEEREVRRKNQYQATQTSQTQENRRSSRR
jgi:hypothetical protein